VVPNIAHNIFSSGCHGRQQMYDVYIIRQAEVPKLIINLEDLAFNILMSFCENLFKDKEFYDSKKKCFPNAKKSKATNKKTSFNLM
jgi:hypothetical protein